MKHLHLHSKIWQTLENLKKRSWWPVSNLTNKIFSKPQNWIPLVEKRLICSMAVYFFFLNDSFLIHFSFWQVWYTRQIVSVFAQDSNNRLYRKRACWFIRLGIVLFERHSVCYENSSIASGNMCCQISKEWIQDYTDFKAKNQRSQRKNCVLWKDISPRLTRILGLEKKHVTQNLR